MWEQFIKYWESDTETRVRRVHELTTREQVLRQLAEESSEVTQAALKLIRAMEGATPVTYQEAIENLAEELGDVRDCVLVLEKSFGGLSALSEAIGEKKMKRWCERLEKRHG